MKINWYEHLSSPAAITGPEEDKEFIVIHWYGKPGASGDVHGTARYLSGVTHASVNFVSGYAGGEGHIYCLVTPTRVAYGQGDGAMGVGNRKGISIECDPRMRREDLETAAHVIARMRREHGKPYPLRPHQHFTQTECPGTYMQQLSWLSARADQINGQGAAPTPSPAPTIQPGKGVLVPDPHWLVEKNENLTMVAKHFGVTVEQVRAFNGLKDANQITVGERLWSPNGRRDTWIVDPGDTLSKISAYYGGAVSVDQLQYANGINNPSTDLKVGMRLVIP